MRPRYCYWSVADGPYAALLQDCVRSARSCGVFKEFHVLTDRALEDCECYDCYQFEKDNGLFKLHFLKVGITRLNFDYFIWLDADSIFHRNPLDPLSVLGRSPLHIPLRLKLAEAEENQSDHGVPLEALRELYRDQGVVNDAYLSDSAFWLVHHDVIEPAYDLALQFWHRGKECGLALDVSHALGYAMQILCADPEGHQVSRHPEVWGAAGNNGNGAGPAIVHLNAGPETETHS